MKRIPHQEEYKTRENTRRNVLRTFGALGTIGLAGCLGDDDGDTQSTGNGSVGVAEISFLGDTRSFDDASCEGSRTFPPENEQIHYRNYAQEFEFWVERHDPAQSDVVEVHLNFPTDSGQTIGEVEGYRGRTSIDAIEFQLGSHTSGTADLEPNGHMNDDVAHDPDGGLVEWDISC